MPTATQLGYAFGLLFLVPLGDKFERRGLILVLIGALVLALAAAALAPNFAALVGASLLIGLFCTVAQQIIPMAAHLPLGVGPTHFARWLALFEATARAECTPAGAEHLIERARRIARSLEMGMAVQRGELPPMRRRGNGA